MTAAGTRTATLRQAGLLLGLAVLLAAGAWALQGGDRLPLAASAAAYRQDLAAPVITIEQALELYRAGEHVFIDTRAGEFDATPHVPGSFPLRLETLGDDLRQAGSFIYPGDPLVLYGSGNLLHVSAVAARLKESGYGNLSIMAGGVPAWSRAGGPLSGGDAGPDGGGAEPGEGG